MTAIDAGVGQLRVYQAAGRTAEAWYIDQPFDLDIFGSAPSAGPYETREEAEAAAHWVWTVVSGAAD